MKGAFMRIFIHHEGCTKTQQQNSKKNAKKYKEIYLN